MGTLTQADGWLACPAAICFAGAVLGASLEGEALLAGVDERVAHGGQVQSPNVGMGWRLWLSAVVGWVRRKTLLDLGRVGSSGGLSTIPLLAPLTSSIPCPHLPHPSPAAYRNGQDGDHVDTGLSALGEPKPVALSSGSRSNRGQT